MTFTLNGDAMKTLTTPSFVRPYQYFVRVVVVLGCMGMLLEACRQQPSREILTSVPVSLKSLCRLTEGQITSMTPTQLERWITTTFDYVPSLSEWDANGTAYSWGSASPRDAPSWFAVVRDQQVVYIAFHDVPDGPSFGEVVDGLGTPTTVYRDISSHDPPLVEFGLDYPTLGVSVYNLELRNRRTLVSGGAVVAPAERDMQVNFVLCYRPADTMEDVLRRDYQDDSIALKIQLSRRAPWPGFGVPILLENIQ